MLFQLLASPTYTSTTSNFTVTVDQTRLRYLTDDTWPNMHDAGAGTSALTGVQARILTTGSSPTWDDITRGLLSWNTSSLPGDCVLVGGTITLHSSAGGVYTGLGDDDLTVAIATPADPTSHVVGDYDQYGAEAVASRVDVTTLSGDEDVSWTLSSVGLAAVSKTGYTSFMVMHGTDFDDSGVADFVASQTSGVTFDGATVTLSITYYEY